MLIIYKLWDLKTSRRVVFVNITPLLSFFLNPVLSFPSQIDEPYCLEWYLPSAHLSIQRLGTPYLRYVYV